MSVVLHMMCQFQKLDYNLSFYYSFYTFLSKNFPMLLSLLNFLLCACILLLWLLLLIK